MDSLVSSIVNKSRHWDTASTDISKSRDAEVGLNEKISDTMDEIDIEVSKSKMGQVMPQYAVLFKDALSENSIILSGRAIMGLNHIQAIKDIDSTTPTTGEITSVFWLRVIRGVMKPGLTR